MPECLESGRTAPPFVGQRYDGGTISSADLRGKPVWLGFYRYASCPTV